MHSIARFRGLPNTLLEHSLFNFTACLMMDEMSLVITTH